MTAPLASVWTRFLALVIDSLILLIPGALIHVTLPFGGPVLLGFLYYPIFHASPLQATPGKKALNIRVIAASGGTLSVSLSFLRHLMATASSCMLFLGHFVAFFTPRRQAIHDLVADSLVVIGTNEGITVVDAWIGTLRRLFGGSANP